MIPSIDRTLKAILACSLMFASIAFNTAQAQLDTEFWFVAPRTTSGHNPDPAQFVIASSGNQTTNVVISKPADPNFNSLNITLNAGATETVTMPLADMVPSPFNANDTIPAKVSNYGFHITSDFPIQIYYQSSATSKNPDIYSLKGKNALGKSFTTPFQNLLGNVPPGEWGGITNHDHAKSAIDIVSTLDGTLVTFTPTAPVSDGNGGVFPAGESQTITLDAGQTYRIKAASQSAEKHLFGTKITSTNPIAVSISDDSVHQPGPNCGDLIGDQMIPENVAGKEYVVMRGWTDLAYDGDPNNDQDIIMVQPIEDGTTITILDSDGGSNEYTADVTTPVRHMLHADRAHIEADKPIYVLHIAGNGCELGGAVLPPIDGCTGSKEVGFVRSLTAHDTDPSGTPNAGDFGLNIFVRSGYEDQFLVDANGGTITIEASDFEVVEGTNGEWMAMHVDYSEDDVPKEVNIRISNPSRFHLGMMYGEPEGGGTRYGYLSSFSNAGSADVSGQCDEGSVELSGRANGDSWSWSDGAGNPLGNDMTYFVTATGQYIVTTTIEGCETIDTLNVAITTPPVIEFDDQVEPCVIPTSFDAAVDPSAVSYIWSTGETTDTIAVTPGQTYSVTIANADGCTTSDVISVPEVPEAQGGNITGDCETSEQPLTAWEGESYQWSDEDGNIVGTDQTYIATVTGTYYVTVTDDEECEFTDEASVVITLPPTIAENEPDPCSNDGVVLRASEDPDVQSYEWSTGETTETIVVTETKSYFVTVTKDGCPNKAEIPVVIVPAPEVKFDPDEAQACDGVELTLAIVTESDYTDLQWTIGDLSGTNDTIRRLVDYNQVIDVTASLMVDGCPFDTAYTVTISPIADYIKMKENNVFSPNADGINDELTQVLDSKFEPCAEMIVYDRWGRIMFDGTKEEYGMTGTWDGTTLDGDNAPAGTYYVLFKIFDPDNNVVGEAKSSVTLIRE